MGKEYHYTYVDHTSAVKESARRKEENKLRNERHQREIAEKQRIEGVVKQTAKLERRKFLERLKGERRAEEEARLREEQRKDEERQRLLELQATSTAKRQGLFVYQFGSKINLANFRELDISDVNKLRIGVFGPTGSGKSCFISTCERVVRNEDKGSSPIASSGAEGTIVLEDFLSEMFFRLVDTRGFFHYDHNETCEFNDILYGRVKPGDRIKRADDTDDLSSHPEVKRKDSPFSDWTHGMILVVNGKDTRLRNGMLKDYFSQIRMLVSKIGISPVTVVTHRDTFKTQKECEDALELASAATGSSRSHTFFVANYCPDNPGPDVNTELQIFDILHFAILTAERYVKIAKQQKKNRQEDQIQKAIDDICNNVQTFVDPTISVDLFLKALQAKYGWKDADLKQVLDQIEQEDIKTIGVLNKTWKDIDKMVPLKMRNVIDKYLKIMFKTSDQTFQYVLISLVIPITMILVYAVFFHSCD